MPGVAHLPLDPQDGRYAGMGGWSPWMRALADAVTRYAAANMIAARPRDYANEPATLRPFRAFEIPAPAYTEEFGADFAISILTASERMVTERLIGTETGWEVFCETFGGSSKIGYNTGGTPLRKESVELSVAPPANILGDADFVAYIVETAKSFLVPWDLDVAAVHIITNYRADVTVAAVMRNFNYGPTVWS